MGINREYLGNFQNKLLGSSSKCVPKYILFPAKLKGEVRPFWNGKAETYSLYPMNYLLHVGVMLTIIKVFIILFLLLRIESILSQNKLVSSAFNWVSRYILFLTKLKGEIRPFLKGARRGATLWDYPQEYLVVIRGEKVSFLRNMK